MGPGHASLGCLSVPISFHCLMLPRMMGHEPYRKWISVSTALLVCCLEHGRTQDVRGPLSIVSSYSLPLRPPSIAIGTVIRSKCSSRRHHKEASLSLQTLKCGEAAVALSCIIKRISTAAGIRQLELSTGTVIQWNKAHGRKSHAFGQLQTVLILASFRDSRHRWKSSARLTLEFRLGNHTASSHCCSHSRETQTLSMQIWIID